MSKYSTGYEHEYLPPELPEEEQELDRPTTHSRTDIIRYITGTEAEEPYDDLPVPNQVKEEVEHEILIGDDNQTLGSPRATRIIISPWEPEILEVPEPKPDPINEPKSQEDLEGIARQYSPRIP